jgi:hypothetical protein
MVRKLIEGAPKETVAQVMAGGAKGFYALH